MSRRDASQPQVINNSCGTIAALNAVMNIPSVDGISVGDVLANMREFGAGMTSMEWVGGGD